MRKLVVLITGFAILGLLNFAIFKKEQLLANGRMVLLELAPVDPRSLMQGDYMALRLKLQRDIPSSDNLQDGFVVVAVDDRNVATFRRLDDGSRPSADELKIFFRMRENEVKLGTNAFFFQEGDARYYETARYGELRVDDNGQILLTGLRDAELRKLGPNRQ